jgi:glycosyltransferase involved in cell wall biosynthesis
MSGSLHIAIVSDTFPPDINGVANTLGKLRDGLRTLGHRVDVIRSGPAHHPEETAVPYWPLPGYWEIHVGAPPPGFFKSRWKRERPDAVYIAIETPLGFAAARAALALGIPSIAGYHTNFRDYLTRYGQPWLGAQVLRYQRWFHNRLPLTLVPSPETHRRLTADGFLHTAVLGRGIDCERFNPSKRSKALRQSWGADEETPVALVVGRVSPEKNIDLALRTFRSLQQRTPLLRAVIVGDGPSRVSLQSAHPDFHFAGYQSGDDLATHYASADFLLFPSKTETFGNVLLEAMASGLSCLAFDSGAAAWHGTHGENLLKAPLGEDDAFLHHAHALLDPSTRQAISHAARQSALSLSWPGIVRQFESHLRQVIFPQCHCHG